MLSTATNRTNFTHPTSRAPRPGQPGYDHDSATDRGSYIRRGERSGIEAELIHFCLGKGEPLPGDRRLFFSI